MTDSEKLDLLLERMQGQKEQTQGLAEQTQGLLGQMQDMNNRLTSIELTLENETNRNIRIIAEGHLDIIRILHDALKSENEKEMLLIRMNSAENEIRLIEEKLRQFA